MKPAPFAYHAPDTVDEVVDLLAEHGWDAKLLAGGQSLVPTMNFRIAQPAVLIDLNRVGVLSHITEAGAGGAGGGNGGDLLIGAMTRQAAVERSGRVAARTPLLAAAMPHIAHSQIRNRGTIGGSIAHADPAAELPAVALALGARFRIRNGDGERRVPASEFFQGLFTTSLGPEDLLTEIAFPAQAPGSGWAFQEIARRHGDYALVGVAATVSLDGDGRCDAARIVLLSVGGAPLEATGAQQMLIGETPDGARLREASAVAAADDIDPVGDLHASAKYRRHLAGVLVRRALAEAFARVAVMSP